MNYDVMSTIPGIESGSWNRELSSRSASMWERVNWRNVAMSVILSALLALTALISARSTSPLYPVLFVAALLIVTYAILRPGFALFLIFAAAGLPALVVPLAFHTMRPIEVTVLLGVLIIFLQRPTMRLRLPHLLTLLFFAIGIISFIHVPSVSTDVNAYSSDKELYLLVLYVIAFFIGTFLVDAIRNISSFLVAVLLSNIPLYIVGLFQAIHIQALTFLQDSDAPSLLHLYGRLLGPFPGPATFGSYLTGLFAVALACWLLGACRRDRVVGGVMAVATALELVGSGTRSAAAAAVVMVIVALVVTRRFKLLLGLIALASVTVIVFLPKIVSVFAHPVTSALSRLFVWQVAFQLIGTHPLLGIGLEQFPVYYAQLIVPRATQLDPNGISVHNQYLAWALSSGILWPLVATALLISIIYFCAKAYPRAQSGQKALLLAVILAVMAVLIISLADVPLEKTEEAVFLFLLAGLALGHVEHILWGKPTTRAAASLASASHVRAASPTGLETSLYKPRTARLPMLNDLRPSTARVATDAVKSREDAPSVQKTGRGIILQLMSWGISAAVIFPATALLTRYLGPVQYGEYSFTIPFLSIFAVFSGSGMDALITRTLSTQGRSRWSETLSFAAGTRMLSTLIVSGCAVLIAFALPVSGAQRVLLLLGSGCLLFSFSFNGLRTVYECGFWAEQRFAIPSIVEAIDRVVTSGLIVVAILFHLSLAWTYILIMYSDIPFFLALVFFASRRFHMRLRFHLGRMREYLVGSLPLTIHNMLSMLVSQVNLLLLLPLAGSFSVGLYGLGLRIMSPLQSIAIMYMIGLYPLLCSQFVAGRKQFSTTYAEMVRILALTIIPLGILVSVESQKIILLMGGAQFVAASTATRILMWAVVATFFSQLAIRGCMAANLERSIPYVTSSALVVNALACILLIPHLQAVGAAVAALSCQFVAFLLFTALLARHVNLLHITSAVLRVLLGNLPALLVLLLLQDTSLILLIPAYVLLAAGGCLVTRTLTLNDISMARQMLLLHRRKDPQQIDKNEENDCSSYSAGTGIK